MGAILNFDLLTLGLTIAAIGILGFVTYLANRKSITNITFLAFAVITVIYSVVNLISYKPFTPFTINLWLFRIVIATAVWHAFFLFQLFYVFPQEKVMFSKKYKYILIPATIFVSLFNLTPFVFSKIDTASLARKAIVEKGILVFGLFVLTLIIAAITLLIRKTIRAKEREKQAFEAILIGTILTFGLLLTFNFIFPAILEQVQYISFAPLFFFPFVAFSFYAILRYNLMNVKVVSTEILVFALSTVTFFEILIADTTGLIVYRSLIFVAVLSFGIFLIKSVVREIEQREEIEQLATQLSRSNDELESANTKLKELDKKKTEFLSLASHQLRSPLTAIKGYSSMILEGSFGKLEKQTEEAIRVVFESSQKLVMVIEDFLNVTRIELGRMKYAFDTIDIGELITNVINEQKPNIIHRGLTITFDKVAGDYHAYADLGKVSQVFSNLIDNSVKYTKEGSLTSKLELIQNDRGEKIIRFSIKDTGVGIGPETLPHLFEKFTRAEDAAKTNIIGTGLGLFVARQIIEAHGGKIWAESAGKGKGSTFFVELYTQKGHEVIPVDTAASEPAPSLASVAAQAQETIASMPSSQTTPENPA